MADPFEVRVRFTSQLQHLNASTTSALKAANYALKHAEFSDDLHSCILEQLERNNMNNRANIMYFLPALCDTAKAQGELGYVRMMERDILRIIDLVAPDDGSGAANVKVVRKVLQQLQHKAFLQSRTVEELEECIAGRESEDVAPPLLPPPAPSAAAGSGGGGGAQFDGTGGSGDATAPASTTLRSTPPHSTSRDHLGLAAGPAVRLDKRQIEQRIEEDRERHKRAREGIWAIPQTALGLTPDDEVGKLWDEGSDVDDEVDYQVAKEDSEERRRHLEFDDN